MKYIVANLDGADTIFVFSRAIDHDRMAEAIEQIRFGSDRNWERKLFKGVAEGKIVSAGFVSPNGECHGRSETLSLDSRGAPDTALLQDWYRGEKGGSV